MSAKTTVKSVLSAMDHSVRWLSSLWFTPADAGEFG